MMRSAEEGKEEKEEDQGHIGESGPLDDGDSALQGLGPVQAECTKALSDTQYGLQGLSLRDPISRSPSTAQEQADVTSTLLSETLADSPNESSQGPRLDSVFTLGQMPIPIQHHSAQHTGFVLQSAPDITTSGLSADVFPGDAATSPSEGIDSPQPQLDDERTPLERFDLVDTRPAWFASKSFRDKVHALCRIGDTIVIHRFWLVMCLDIDDFEPYSDLITPCNQETFLETVKGIGHIVVEQPEDDWVIKYTTWRENPLPEDECWQKFENATGYGTKSVTYLRRVYQPGRTESWIRMFYLKHEKHFLPVEYFTHHYLASFKPWLRRQPMLDKDDFITCIARTLDAKIVLSVQGYVLILGVVQSGSPIDAREADKNRRVAELRKLERKGAITRPAPFQNAFQAKLWGNPLLPWPNDVPTYSAMYEQKRREIRATTTVQLTATRADWWRDIEIQAAAEAKADIEDEEKARERMAERKRLAVLDKLTQEECD